MDVRFAVAGCGAIGVIHAQVLSSLPGARLSAVFDVREAAARALAERFGCDYETDLDALLARDDVDAISICVPSGLHGELTARAAAAGKQVICEKPLDTSLPRAEAMAAVCRAHGVTLYPILQHRLDPATEAVKAAVERGALGRLLWGSAHVIWYRDDAYYKSSWRGTAALDGGALLNQSIHTIDLLVHLLGKPVSVRGKCAARRSGRETEDVGVACVEFESGALGSIEGTTDAYPGLYSELSLYGEKGTVILRNDQVFFSSAAEAPELAAMAEPDAFYTLHPDASVFLDGHLRQYRDIVRAISTGTPPRNTAEDALCSLKVVLGIYEASRTDSTVRL